MLCLNSKLKGSKNLKSTLTPFLVASSCSSLVAVTPILRLPKSLLYKILAFHPTKNLTYGGESKSLLIASLILGGGQGLDCCSLLGQLDGGARALVSLSAQEQVHLEKKYKLLGIVASQIEPYFEDCVWGS